MKRVLQDNADNYGRKTRSVDALRDTLGNGLLTTTGPAWWRNRRLAQPSFHKQRLAGFAGIMAEASADFVERLARAGAGGASFDLVPEMSRLTLSILGRCLFERELTDDADAVGGALQIVLRHTMDKLGSLIPLPGVFPTPRNLRFRKALRALDKVVLSLIDQRRRDGADRGDLLSALLAARDEDTGEGLDDRQLRDEVMTLLLAGHETTAMALSWTFYLLSLHPGARRTLEGELDAALAAGATPRLEDLPRLRTTRMVLDESLRLYPPAWVITRSADGPDELGGFAIPAGSARAAEPVRHAARSRVVGRSGGVRSRALRAGARGECGAQRPRPPTKPSLGPARATRISRSAAARTCASAPASRSWRRPSCSRPWRAACAWISSPGVRSRSIRWSRCARRRGSG